MPINPNIALSGKPLELQDPLAAYGRIAAIQQAQNQNALAQMQMDEYARARKEEEGVRNYLAGKDINTPETQAGLYQYGKTGVDYATKLQAAQAAKTELDLKTYDLRRKKLESAVTHITSLDSPEDAIASINDSLKNGSVDLSRATQLLDSLNKAGPNGFQDWKRRQLQPLLSAKEQFEATAPKIARQDLGGQIAALQDNPNLPGYGLPMENVPTLQKTLPPQPFQRVATDMGGNILGGRFNPATGLTEYTETVAKSLPPAPPKETPAPTVTQVIDPNNPERMLTVDARRYQGGSEGAPGVIGVAGKEPSAALRNTKIEQGKTQLQDDLDNLRASFTALNDMRAIPSTERGVISNLMAASQSSGVGQALGRATGTKEQVERDVISSAKQRLLTSIKNATGMSAQQLNSNMELQAMLRSLSDVNLGFEASMRIIDDIEDTYVKGAAKKAAPATGNAPKPAALSSVDQQALDWANANPKDPRAAQIKQRLGR